MIGNDIVDLKYSASNWKRPRFLDKVFTQNEQALIFSSENKHETLWLLWSMKEAAYKIHVQQFGERFFNPKRLVCELISEDKGLIRIDDNNYFTTSAITENYVHTIATLSASTTNMNSVFKAEIASHHIQSDILKKALLKSISKTKQLPLQDLEIKKTTIGVPELFCDDSKLPMSFSLTHCGRFSGFVY
ncbi:4'-phosphopantetheinyl transferase superfamily protein [Psychroserpens luteus]|uniref:4'-phosphopantetheinyl transferase superfamily protein n=1 Tax=Psychroserpens luteus TaxID=1434066 RepID=A0ABW5ZRZ7_9FLAO|nr:4'-phosphopantetheinyl transferase superfamily protein [Psychroserpens luteus]